MATVSAATGAASGADARPTILRLPSARPARSAGDRRRRLLHQLELLEEAGLEIAATPAGPLLLKVDGRVDHDGGGLFPEGYHAACNAIAGAKRDANYCDSVHAGGAFTAAVVAGLRASGLTLRVEAGVLHVGPREKVTPGLLEAVRQHKAALVAALEGK